MLKDPFKFKHKLPQIMHKYNKRVRELKENHEIKFHQIVSELDKYLFCDAYRSLDFVITND